MLKLKIAYRSENLNVKKNGMSVQNKEEYFEYLKGINGSASFTVIFFKM